MTKIYFPFLLLLSSSFISTTSLHAQMRITEFEYNGSEFVEFTNIGSAGIDMTGWSFSDNARHPGDINLSTYGIVQAGESVILSEESASAFRSRWGLCAGVKIIGSNTTNNLGRSDEINLYNNSGTLVDRLTFNDQGTAPQGGPRTDVKSAWVPASALGTNEHNKWILSNVADAEASFTATGGYIGSPGKSTRATVAYNPCSPPPNGAPTIAIDVTSTSNLLDGGAVTTPVSPYALSGVINDAQDPLTTLGIDLIIGDDVTPAGSLTVSVSSSNTAVVPSANIVFTGTGAARNLKITPAAVGYSNISITVGDGTYNTIYIINYAASQTSSTNARWLTGISDASAAIALDDNYMLIANDESNLLYIYDRSKSGLPIKTYDFNQGNVLGLTDGSSGNWKEVDVEAGVRSINNAGRIYWLGSMSNSSSFNDKPNRNRLFAVTVSGTGSATNFSDAGHYNNLRQQLITWGDANGYAFSTSAAAGMDPKLIDGFNIEGMVFGPDNSSMYIGFRAPLVPTAGRTKAVIAPIQNFESWFNNGSPAGNPVIGAPIELNLNNRGIRDMIRLSNGTYIIIAGNYDNLPVNGAVYRWSGNAADAPIELPAFGITSLNAEAAMQINEGGILSQSKLQIITDNGSDVFYNDGTEAKDLPQDNFKKFAAEVIVSPIGGVLPIQFVYFTAAHVNDNALLNWKMGAIENTASFTVERSYDGYNFTPVSNITVIDSRTSYSYQDVGGVKSSAYYRIKAISKSGQREYSEVRYLNNSTASTVKIFPNPVINNSFMISTSAEGNKQLIIYNADGSSVLQTQFTAKEQKIITTGWRRGVYLIKITDETTITTTRIIVD